jgi:histone deacetylase 6
MKYSKGRFSTDDEIEKCHTARVNKLMSECDTMSTEELKHLSTEYDSMYFHQKSNTAARFALGSSIDLMDSILSGKVDNGFAIIRPPGHHAMHNEPNGYCYFNNAAVVAKLALEKHNMKRVVIIDWDGKYLFFMKIFKFCYILTLTVSSLSPPWTGHSIPVL